MNRTSLAQCLLILRHQSLLFVTLDCCLILNWRWNNISATSMTAVHFFRRPKDNCVVATPETPWTNSPPPYFFYLVESIIATQLSLDCLFPAVTIIASPESCRLVCQRYVCARVITWPSHWQIVTGFRSVFAYSSWYFTFLMHSRAESVTDTENRGFF